MCLKYQRRFASTNTGNQSLFCSEGVRLPFFTKTFFPSLSPTLKPNVMECPFIISRYFIYLPAIYLFIYQTKNVTTSIYHDQLFKAIFHFQMSLSIKKPKDNPKTHLVMLKLPALQLFTYYNLSTHITRFDHCCSIKLF